MFHDSLRLFRLDDLRHRLIPLYRYDPAEELGWGDCDEEELAVRNFISKDHTCPDCMAV